MEKYNLLLVVLCVTLFGTIFMLLKKKHLREKYAILWLLISLSIPIIIIFEKYIDRLSLFVGIKYPPTFVFMVAIGGILLLLLMLSVIVSHQTDRIIALSQKVALLENMRGKESHSDRANRKV
jgi:hypothetical protein